MGRVCSTHRKEEIFTQGFNGKLERKTQPRRPRVDGIILKCKLTI
jgi:hypothetical protein